MNNRNKRTPLFLGLSIGLIMIFCNMVIYFQVNDIMNDRYTVSPLRDPVETKPTQNRDWINLDTNELQVLFAGKKKDNPIFIDGDSDFIKQARKNQWPGKGTEAQPYVIQDLNIKVVNRSRGKKLIPVPLAAITIYNTTLYFYITNNILDGINGIPDGVLLENVSNGVIGPANYIFNCRSGVTLINSNFIEIYGNFIYGYIDTSSFSSTINFKIAGPASISHGIFLDPSYNNSIVNNHITDFTGNGIFILNSTNNTIDGNEINNILGENGIFLAGSNTTTIKCNDIFFDAKSTVSDQNIKYKIMGPASISHGIFLDPSYNNTIRENNVSGYTRYGLFLLKSDGNDLFENDINSSTILENGAGIFLNGSDWNNVTENNIYSNYSRPLPIDSNIKYKITGPASISHGIFLDPSDNNIIKNNRIFNNTGNGLYLQDSESNEIIGNQIANNGDNGIFIEDSKKSNISNNVFYNDDFYAISLNYGSNSNSIGKNDLIGNNIGGASQALDNGYYNQFINNFMVDHDNTDTNNDTLSDNPYYIEGISENSDPSPKALPVQNLTATNIKFTDLDAWVDWESETLNLKNEGNWETVKIKLPEGYSVTNIDVSTVYTNGSDGGIYTEDPQVQNARTLIVKFNRTALVEYLQSVFDPSDLPKVVEMNVTGYLNGDFQRFYGYDNVTVIHGDPNLKIDVNLESKSLTQDINLILTKAILKSPAMAISVFPFLLFTIIIRELRRKIKF